MTDPSKTIADKPDNDLTSGDETSSIQESISDIFKSEVKSTVFRVQQLIKYAAEAGKPVDEKSQKYVAQFSRKVISGENWTADEEATFWDSTRNLSASLYPVTYDTLTSSGRIAKRYVWSFGILTLLLLAFLVYAQFVWVVLSNVTGTIEARITDLNVEEIQIEQLYLQGNSFAKELESLVEPASATAINSANRNDRIRELRENIKSNHKTRREKEVKILDVKDELNASTRILVSWLPLQGWLRTTRPPDPSMWDSKEEEIEKLENINEWEYRQEEESSFRNKTLHTWSKQILQGMSAYLLPMIYGLVGACAFVLRSMSRQIRELTFSATDSTVQYMLRLVLGALAGISIGWFLKPETSVTVVATTISPLAVAFVAGYSVELLFTAMDKVIKAFTGAGPGQPKKQEET